MKLSLISRHPILQSFLDEMPNCESSAKKLIRKDPLVRFPLLNHQQAKIKFSLNQVGHEKVFVLISNTGLNNKYIFHYSELTMIESFRIPAHMTQPRSIVSNI